MRTVIISDAHLKFHENEEDLQRRLKVSSFLKTLKSNTDLLIINGDFFDLWVAWKHVIIRNYFPVLEILSELVRSGTRIVMTPGNHDFWFNTFLSEQIGIEICKDSFLEEINGKRFFINHGDRFTRNDIRYQVYRFFIRNKLIQKLFYLFHPDFALETGIKMSRSSRKRKVPKRRKEIMIKCLKEAAEKLIIANDYDYVIFGHSHIPTLEDCASGVYANAGDWISNNTYLEFDGNKLELKKYRS